MYILLLCPSAEQTGLSIWPWRQVRHILWQGCGPQHRAIEFKLDKERMIAATMGNISRAAMLDTRVPPGLAFLNGEAASATAHIPDHCGAQLQHWVALRKARGGQLAVGGAVHFAVAAHLRTGRSLGLLPLGAPEQGSSDHPNTSFA